MLMVSIPGVLSNPSPVEQNKPSTYDPEVYSINLIGYTRFEMKETVEGWRAITNTLFSKLVEWVSF